MGIVKHVCQNAMEIYSIHSFPSLRSSWCGGGGSSAVMCRDSCPGKTSLPDEGNEAIANLVSIRLISIQLLAQSPIFEIGAYHRAGHA